MDSSLLVSTQLSEALTKLGLDAETLIPRYQVLHQLLLEANTRMNLTRITDWEDFCYKHVIDTLTLLPELPDSTRTVMDVGTGGGIPGLPLWLARPDLELTMLDSVGKKLKAVEDMITGLINHFPELAANRPKTLHMRAEDAGVNPQHRQQYDAVISRAVAAMPVLVEFCLPLVKRTGVFIAMKGPNYTTEMQGMNQICGLLGARLDEAKTFEINGEQRVLLVFEKRSLTPKTLPRPAGHAKKKPLTEFLLEG